MKKYFVLLMIVCLCLTGCGKRLSQTGYTTLLCADVSIALNAPAAPVLAALGAPFGYGESKSGVYSGVEKTYQFSGLRLKTFQAQDGERILGMMITDKNLTTPDGLAVGDTAQQVRSCFGENCIQDNCCIINRDQEQMIVLLENNFVTAIQYTLV